MDKIAGSLEVGRTAGTHEIVISHPALNLDGNSLEHIVFLPRQARHLANVLVEHATYAEAEAIGTLPESRPYRRANTTVSKGINSLFCLYESEV